MNLIFLGTGGAWGLPELNCNCRVCCEMRLKGERRRRTSLLLSGETNLLIDCGPDIASQLSEHQIESLDAVLITHEHGDHYMGLDELFSYKRTCPRGTFNPIPVYITKHGIFYRPRYKFREFMIANYDFDFIGARMIEDWHKGCLKQVIVRNDLLRIRPKEASPANGTPNIKPLAPPNRP